MRRIDQRDDPLGEATRGQHDEERGSCGDRPGDELCLDPLNEKIGWKAQIEKSNEQRDHKYHHARHHERQYQLGSCFYICCLDRMIPKSFRLFG